MSSLCVLICASLHTHTHRGNVECEAAISQVVGTIPQHREQLPLCPPPLQSSNEAAAIGRNALFQCRDGSVD